MMDYATKTIDNLEKWRSRARVAELNIRREQGMKDAQDHKKHHSESRARDIDSEWESVPVLLVHIFGWKTFTHSMSTTLIIRHQQEV